MVRSFGIGLVVLGVACAGPARSQQPASAPTAGAGERIMVLQEKGMAPQRCRVLQSWREADGSRVHQAQSLNTGQMFTIVELGPAAGAKVPPGSGIRATTTRIYRWGADNRPPPGTPMPPAASAATAPSRPASAPASSSAAMTTGSSPARPSTPNPQRTPAPVASTATPSNIWPPSSPGTSPYTRRQPVSRVSPPPSGPSASPPPAYGKWPTTAQASPPVPAVSSTQTAQRPLPLPVPTPTSAGGSTSASAGRWPTANPTQGSPPAPAAPYASPYTMTTQRPAPLPVPTPASRPTPTPSSRGPTVAQGSPPAIASPYALTPQRPAPVPTPTPVGNCPDYPPALDSTTPCPCSPQCGGSSPTVVGKPCPCCPPASPQVQRRDQTCPCCPPKTGSCLGGLFNKGPSNPSGCACNSAPASARQPLPTTTTTATRCPDCMISPVKESPPVVEPAAPQRQGLLARWKSQPKGSGSPACNCASSTTSIVAKPAVPPVPPAATPPASKPAEAKAQRPRQPAEPGDFRESWGQTAPWKPTLPQPENQPPKKQVVKAQPPGTDRSKPRPMQTARNATENRPVDPIKDPEWYNQKAQNTLPGKQAPADKSVSGMAGRPALLSGAVAGSRPEDKSRTPALAAGAANRPGFQSVLAAGPAAGAAAAGSAGLAQGAMPPVIPFPTMPASPPPPPPNPYPLTRPIYQRPMPPDQGVPSGLANAFTVTSGTTRPIPANFGPPPVAANAFTDTEHSLRQSQGDTMAAVPPEMVNGFSTPTPPRTPDLPPNLPSSMALAMAGRTQVPMGPMGPMGPAGFGPGMNYGGPPANPTMMAQARPPMLQALPQAHAGGTNSHQLMAVLKDSLYPSQREWAADCLSRQDWRVQPQVVQALLTAAREDPAATVRAGCVRALAHMKVNILPVVGAVQALKADADPRVRQEVEEALPALGVAPQTQPDANVRPASLPESVGETK